MLLAIDVGNTHTVFGAWNGGTWVAIWRRETDPHTTEDDLAVWLQGVCDLSKVEFAFERAICCSVVPDVDASLGRLCRKYLGLELWFLTTGSQVGLAVDYDPPQAVGADRIANAIGAMVHHKPPIIVVDFGTATTFDSIGPDGTYLGGAILPGVRLSSEALFAKAAKLPSVDYVAPETALGKNTRHSLQAGIMIGYAGAIDTLAQRIDQEMGGGSTIVATGGLGGLFVDICRTITGYEPNLTLDGLVLAANRNP